ncbi:hypothetical protein [Janthinobacterium lividum]|uniref:hypothetical protein n=1 Tax=Janthinobacterium lividum TaxID=29581 RepID=UPI0008743792|nr:hypothetical protein [Janthinobacterium lividum]MCC7716576.1 hypothetical protein [Janthinobacterium lividum]OEZ62929.1 hypothetical protein JANLI_09020 [Janthinobacterium lividum]WQE30870.1 hypothetical protein U0004_10850 [Janthinobacterium lividum]STQ96390.1 Uncharacterised protein [Janthinobacterium lividum]
MSQLPALASRQPASNTLAGQQPSRTGSSATGLAASPLMQRTAQDVVALSKNGLDLSAKGLSQRTDALGNATVDVAQDFLSTMTRQLFGDGATVAFDSVDLQAGSSFSSGSASVSGAGGSSRAAAFSLNENAHFIGKGKITTADGQTFDFEVEVQYQSSISAGVLEQTQNATEEAGSADDAQLPAKELPATHFGGNLHDLFKLLGQQLQSNLYQGTSDGASASGKDDGLAGSLSLRLLKLVQPDHATETAKADRKAVETTPEEQARARALALAYGTDTASSTVSNV